MLSGTDDVKDSAQEPGFDILEFSAGVFQGGQDGLAARITNALFGEPAELVQADTHNAHLSHVLPGF